jgi:hypothetical protein
MTFTCDFDATPRGVVSGKTVRFYPRVSGNISPITNYNWDFGDGSSPVDEPTPIHTFPVVTEYTTYDVILTVTDSNSNQATHTNEDFITSDIDDNVVIPNFNINVIVFIWDDNNSMQVKRQAYPDCNLYLISPKISDQLDKIGTATFALLDIGTATADELSLIKEGSNVAISSNQGISFQGVIRRAGQDLQGAFAQTTRVKKWNIECDSDLARHKKMPILGSQLTANGEPVIDSPGYIARRLLTPAGGAQDVRGVIDCIDPKIAYRLNSTAKEEVGSQYEHLMTLRDATNYDLRSRPYGTVSLGQTLGWGYQPFNGNFEIGEPFGDYDQGWGECGEIFAPGAEGQGQSVWGNWVGAEYKKDGTYGMRMSVRIDDADPDHYWDGGAPELYTFGCWNCVMDMAASPAGFTSISFDYKIHKWSHPVTYTDDAHQWGSPLADGESAACFWLEMDKTPSTTLWRNTLQEETDWIHVVIDVPTSIASGIDFYFTLNNCFPTNQGQTYEYEFWIDNFRYHYPDDVAAGVWAYIKLIPEGVMPTLWDCTGCQLPNGHIIVNGGLWIWYAPNYTFYRSIDNGNTFQVLAKHEDIFPSQLCVCGTKIVAQVYRDYPYHKHNIIMSEDEGLTWTVMATDQPGYASEIYLYWNADTSTLYRLCNGFYSDLVTLYTSTDYGATWTQVVFQTTPWIGKGYTGDSPSQIIRTHDGTLTMFAYLWCYTSTDGGLNWTEHALLEIPEEYGGYAGYPIFEFTDNVITMFGGEAGSPGAKVCTSTDHGATWTAGTTIVGGPGYYDRPFFPKADGTCISYGFNHYDNQPCWYHSTDWCQSWTLINGIPPGSLIGSTYYFGSLGIVETADDNNGDTVAFYDADPNVRFSTGESIAEPTGYVIDFAPDVSQPHAVKNLDVNKDCFGFNDNDGKEKLSTQIVVRGKDYQGKSISVQVAGVHAYNINRKFFNDSTYINQKSEGYIYKNSYSTDISKACTFTPGSSVTYMVNYNSGDHYLIYVGASGFAIGNLVSFTNPPPGLAHNTAYYIVYHTGSYIKVSATQGGSPIHLNWCTYYRTYTWEFSTYGEVGGTTMHIYIKGTLAKSIWINGDPADSGHQIAEKIVAAFAGGYVDADGNTWTVTCDMNYSTTYFRCNNEELASSVVDIQDAYYCSPNYVGTTTSYWDESVVLTASDVGTVMVNNLDGWFTENMQIEFGATELPTGVSAGTIYNVGNAVTISATAVFMLKYEGSVVNFTTAGTDVVCFKPNTIHNPDENGNPCVWLYDWGYAIKDGDYLAISIPGESSSAMRAVGTPIEVVDLNGVMCTTVQVDTFGAQDYGGGKGFLLNKRLYVEDADIIGQNYALVGEELVLVSDTGVDIAYGPYINLTTVTNRISGANNKCYPHSLGALVAKTNYTTAAPETGSPIDLYGIHVLDETVDNNVTYGDLDAYATVMLLGLGQFWKKGTCWLPLSRSFVNRIAEYPETKSFATPIVAGDHLTVTEFSGATPEDWQVVSVETIYDEGRMKLELGDFEKNVFTSLERKTNALNRTMT